MIDIVQYVYDSLLEINLPVLYEKRPSEVPCMSFHIFNEQGDIYGDGLNEITKGKIQIDIFAKKTNEIRKYRKEVIANLLKLNTIKFLKTIPDELTFESQVNLFHQVIVFNFYHLEDN